MKKDTETTLNNLKTASELLISGAFFELVQRDHVPQAKAMTLVLQAVYQTVESHCFVEDDLSHAVCKTIAEGIEAEYAITKDSKP